MKMTICDFKKNPPQLNNLAADVCNFYQDTATDSQNEEADCNGGFGC